MEQFSLQAMSPSGPGAFEFLGVQNASESNGMVVKGTTTAEFGPGKPQTKTRFMKDLSRIKPQMMLKLLSSIDLSEVKKVHFSHVNRLAEGFNEQSEASSHAEIMELFPLSTGFGTEARVTNTNLTLPFANGLCDPNSRSVQSKAPEQASTAQLTIFYNGAVNVYDMAAEKAQAIMKLAGANSSSNTRTSSITSCKIEQISQQQPSKTALDAVNEKPPVDLEIVRKLSLRRFLQKRKERFNSVAPYTTMETATFPSK